MGALDCVMKSKITPTDSTEVFTVNMSSETSLNAPRKDLESQLLKPDSGDQRHSIRWCIGLDVPLIVLVVVLIGLFEFGVIPQKKSGFYCNDPALSFPFTGDTVSMVVIILSILLIPLLLVFPTELLFSDSSDTNRSKLYSSACRTLKIYRNYAFGLSFNFAIIEVMKGLIGNPRPTFFDLCEPDTAKTCNGTEFVSTFECTSTKYSSFYQRDSYRSFPSGHTSLSVHCALFMVWYFQRRAFSWQNRSIFLVPTLQLLCLSYAAVSSLTRISDHRHHWWDVLTGTVIGIASSLYSVLVLCENFSRTYFVKDKRIIVSQHSVQIFDGTPQEPVQ